MVIAMADVDITSLSVEISAESQGAELNIDKLATAISNLRTKGNVTKVVNSLDKLATSIATLKQASAGMSGLDKITSFLNGLSNVNTTASAKSINTVVNAIKKIPAAVSGLNGVDFYSMSGSITQLTNALAPLSILDASNLKALGSAFNAIGKVPDLTDKLKATDLDSFASSCQKISVALTPLASQLDKVGNAFAKLPPQLSKVVTQANRVTAANEKQRKSYLSLSNQMNGFMRNMAKLVSLKAIADYLGNAVAKFNDFYEAANMFGVSMGDMTNEASGFIDKMEQLLGIDPSEAMNAMANIYSMTKSFGLAKEQAYTLSKSLTQLGYDLSSLKNIPISQAFTKIRSAMAGELEPMLQLGVDISQARLQQELLALGFNKQVSTLSQADKATLRYIAILKQTTDAQGDFARTLSSPANMIRILKAQLSGLARDVGSLLYPAMKSILPPLIAAVELIREFVQWVAKLMGVKVVLTDFAKSADSVGGIGDAMDETTDSTKKAAKALKDYTMGFDELNIIDPTQGSSGSGSGASAGNILGDVDLSGYDMFKQYNEEFAKQIDAIKQKIKDMLPVIGAISAAFALWKITNFLTDIATAISKMTDLQKLALSIATVVVEASLVFSFAKGYASSGNPLELLGEVVSAAFGSFVLWRTMGADGVTLGMGIAFVASLAGLTYALGTGEANLGDASTWIQAALTTAFGSITGITLLTNLGAAAGTAATLSIGLAGLITFAGITFSLGEKLKEFPVLDTIITALMGIFGGVAGAGVALLVGASLPVAGAVAAAGVGIGLVLHWAGIKWGAKESGEKTDAAAEADIKMHYVETVFEQRIDAIKQIIVTKWNAVIDFMTSLPEKVGNIVSSIGEWFSSLPEKIGYALGFAVGKIGEWVGNMVVTVTTEVPKIVSSVVKFFEELPGNIWTAILKALDVISKWRERMVAFVVIEIPKIVSSIVGEFKKLPDELRKLGKFIWDGLINGLKDAWSTVTNGIKNFTDGFVNGFKDALEIHSPSQVFHQIGVYVVQGLANGIIGSLGYVNDAMNKLVDATKLKGEEMANYGIDCGTSYVNGIISGLDSKWAELDNNLKTNFFGTVQTFIQAAQSGDWKTVGTTIAAGIWGAMGDEQRKRAKSVASDLVSRLSKELKSQASSLLNTAATIGKNLVNNLTQNFGKVSAETQTMLSGITQAFGNVKSPLATAAKAISAALSGGLLSSFPTIFAGFASLVSTIGTAVAGMLSAVGAALSATIFGIPAGIVALAAAATLGVAIAGIVSKLGGSRSTGSYSDTSQYVGSSSYNSSTSSSSYSGTYSAASGNSEEMRDAVYNGCYNAFLDIWQRYGEEISDGRDIRVYLDGKQLTASVEKTQKERGVSIMGTEVYSY
jgi:hypothetical protein|nr:MAG TPA_asm: minor tail protein [Caudoviricetes sp.]